MRLNMQQFGNTSCKHTKCCFCDRPTQWPCTPLAQFHYKNRYTAEVRLDCDQFVRSVREKPVFLQKRPRTFGPVIADVLLHISLKQIKGERKPAGLSGMPLWLLCMICKTLSASPHTRKNPANVSLPVPVCPKPGSTQVLMKNWLAL